MKLNQYEWVLFDADDTLFHFDAFAGLQLMFKNFKVNFTVEDYAAYQAINKALWVEYQNASITAKQLQHKRFDEWANKLEISPHTLNSAFLSAMADICYPLEGATSLLEALQGKSKLGIITNGFTELQEIRLERTGLRKHFDILVISEEVGIAKPHPDIFNYALDIMGNPKRDKVLMVGDNPDSDIIGGINSGLHTCWLNRDNKTKPLGIEPNYQVSSLTELEKLLLEK
jgi:YjjG family noncanonical pyrimidine nucleotidase